MRGMLPRANPPNVPEEVTSKQQRKHRWKPCGILPCCGACSTNHRVTKPGSQRGRHRCKNQRIVKPGLVALHYEVRVTVAKWLIDHTLVCDVQRAFHRSAASSLAPSGNQALIQTASALLLSLDARYVISLVNDASSLLPPSPDEGDLGLDRPERTRSIVNAGPLQSETVVLEVMEEFSLPPHLSVLSFEDLNHTPGLPAFSNTKTSLHRLRRCTGSTSRHLSLSDPTSRDLCLSTSPAAEPIPACTFRPRVRIVLSTVTEETG